MKIEITNNHSTTIVTVCQHRIDASGVPILRAKINELLRRPCAEIIIDLQQVAFIDSSILGALVASYKLTISNGGTFALCGIGGAVLELLELTRLDSVFPCYASVEDAQNYLRAA